MILTVRKNDGPGWLMIAEVIEDNRYKIVRDICAKEPQYEVILRFLHSLPARLKQIEGTEVEWNDAPKKRNAKRAAQEAKREMDRAGGQRMSGKAFQMKAAELEKAAAVVRETLDVTIWVKPGKPRTVFHGERYKGMDVLEVCTPLSDKRANEEVINAFKKRYGVYESDIELTEGYASQKKRFTITLRKAVQTSLAHK
ncbi:DUF167 family protein [Brevibacillus massiliensis]|uniref:DUF167 family protein n=1 Tax=Brevibacillus massiliensis TaxID=1118054 RepID=UPI0002F7F419|nr:DUF167 family protein [Brevibacillus massiliensis]